MIHVPQRGGNEENQPQTRPVWDCQSGLPIRPGVVERGSIDRHIWQSHGVSGNLQGLSNTLSFFRIGKEGVRICAARAAREREGPATLGTNDSATQIVKQSQAMHAYLVLGFA